MRPTNVPKSNPLLSTTELAQQIGVCARTVARWRAEGLPYLRLSAISYRYDLRAVMAWLEARGTVASQNEVSPEGLALDLPKGAA